MAENGGVDWHLVAEELASCTCDWACPCQFEGDPNHGYCRAIIGMSVIEGHYGDVDLTGAKFGVVVSFPGPLYEGNGTAQLFLDEESSDEQREAIQELNSGKQGGVFFQVLSTIIPNHHETVVTSIEFASDREKRVATMRFGDAATVEVEPIISPATGEEHRVRIDLPNGIEYKQAEVANTVSGTASGSDPLSFTLENTYAQLTRIDWTPTTVA